MPKRIQHKEQSKLKPKRNLNKRAVQKFGRNRKHAKKSSAPRKISIPKRRVTLHLPRGLTNPIVFVPYPADVNCEQRCQRQLDSETESGIRCADNAIHNSSADPEEDTNPSQNALVTKDQSAGCEASQESIPAERIAAEETVEDSSNCADVAIDTYTAARCAVAVFTSWKHRSIVNVYEGAGISIVGRDDDWSVYFGTTDKRQSEDGQKISVSNDRAFFKNLKAWQKISHFPGTWALGRKDRLAFSVNAMRRAYPGSTFDFLPSSFVMPKDAYHLKRHLASKASTHFKDNLWIIKPVSDSCGRGISVISKSTLQKRWKNYSDPRRKKSVVIQQYCARPYLINGVKFDLRLYVLVTSIQPLVVYLYDEGLVRLCTKKYSITKKNLKDLFVHLTNYSINKDNEDFQANEGDGDEASGHKWSLAALKNHWRTQNVDVDKVMADVRLLIAKTFVAVESEIYGRCYEIMGNRACAFELFGFDLMFEEDLTPRLVEVSSTAPQSKLYVASH